MEDTIKNTFRKELDALATIRDELKLKAHLARQDVRDELGQLEGKLRLAEEELGRTKAHAGAELSRMGQELKLLLVDLKQEYEAVRRRFAE
ncbi:MAG TPA: hypothetical protein VFZ61_25365 [Polyangiales bacterium]